MATNMSEQVETFKKILEYFVKHMVYAIKKCDDKIKYSTNLSFTDEQTQTNFIERGKGYNDHRIQKQMEIMADVSNNCFGDTMSQKICISIDITPNGFKKASYLHLVSCGDNSNTTNEAAETNINPIFKEQSNEVYFWGLQVGPNQNSPTFVFPPLEYTFEEIGLLPPKTISQEEQKNNLYTFYCYFMEMRKAELMGALTYKGKEQLLATHNMILTGAPGTGKTWSAMNIAAWIICNKPYEKLDPNDMDRFNKQYELVQFHPSYDYTDFVEGLRPVSNDDDSSSESNINNTQQKPSTGSDIGFKLMPGVFRRFCVKALNAMKDKEEDKFVFIIDEINRGELSKIFGELFFSIDPGYRGPKGAVLTQYANMSMKNEFDNELGSDLTKFGHFFVPENVYIIGTMNDIDRSVESMDFAMRRRFSFIEVKANEREDMWTEDWKDIAKMCMEAVNKEIESIPGLSSAYHIGPAYFKKLNDYPIEEGGNTVGYDFFKLWDNHLYGVIYEYLRGKKDAKDTINKIQDKYLEALCNAIRTRFNYSGKWGGKLISQATNASSIDSRITDEKTAKVYLGQLKKPSYNSDKTTNDRSTDIFKLSNDVKKYLAIGKRIEDLK